MVMIPLAELIEGSNVLKDLDIHKCLIKRLEEPGISLAESIGGEDTQYQVQLQNRRFLRYYY